jgi:hypothetical protein
MFDPALSAKTEGRLFISPRLSRIAKEELF